MNLRCYRFSGFIGGDGSDGHAFQRIDLSGRAFNILCGYHFKRSICQGIRFFINVLLLLFDFVGFTALLQLDDSHLQFICHFTFGDLAIFDFKWIQTIIDQIAFWRIKLLIVVISFDQIFKYDFPVLIGPSLENHRFFIFQINPHSGIRKRLPITDIRLGQLQLTFFQFIHNRQLLLDDFLARIPCLQSNRCNNSIFRDPISVKW